MQALGAMSGTSLDGVDAAVIETDGVRITGFGPSDFRPYTDAERDILRLALGEWEGEYIETAADVVEAAHVELLAKLPGAVIGIHGQTVAHAPEERRTLQVGDGALMAEALQRTVVWDFRTDDVALGGQGAPLAPAFHFACARWAGLDGAAFLNLGGVGNLTWIAPGAEDPAAPGALIAFDTGPANALIDDLVSDRTGARYDEGGALADAGDVHEGIVERFLSLDYFARPAPKSLDREAFGALAADVRDLGDADAAATLTAATAAAVATGLALCPSVPDRLLVTGGGRRNPVMMAMIADLAGVPVAPVESVGLDGDMLEAQAFAYLAVRVLKGLPTSFPGTTGIAAPIGGGRVSRPTLPLAR